MNKKVRFYTLNMKWLGATIKRINRFIEILKTDKTKYTLTVIILSMFIAAIPQLSYADAFTELGEHILGKIELYMGIVVTILASVEISTELLKGGRNYTQILFKYGGGYIALILAPMVMQIIRDLF